ncbi:MAG: YbaK/EbsC family protein [Myxococcaceae bacterium]|nr:YbaK/EbsC family protein [Myxococcaceae bacterium]
MIPRPILDYLDEHGVHARVLQHPKAVTAQKLAEALHVSGKAVAKTVAFEADGQIWLAVIPANERLDLGRVQQALGTVRVRLLREDEFGRVFHHCEVGAEPPFGHLFGVPMLVDDGFRRHREVVVRAGTHTDSLLMTAEDLANMEAPKWASIAVLRETGEPQSPTSP